MQGHEAVEGCCIYVYTSSTSLNIPKYCLDSRPFETTGTYIDELSGSGSGDDDPSGSGSGDDEDLTASYTNIIGDPASGMVSPGVRIVQICQQTRYGPGLQFKFSEF